jgi:hypothetical protein
MVIPRDTDAVLGFELLEPFRFDVACLDALGGENAAVQ